MAEISQTVTVEEPEKRTNGPVIQGKAKIKKKTIFSKFKDAFIREDSKSIGSYIVEDVAIPVIIGGVSNILHSMIDAYFNRDGRTGSSYVPYGQSTWKPNASMISYGSIYDKKKQMPQIPTPRDTMIDFGDLGDLTMDQANEILSSMDELISRYHQASINDYLDLAGLAGPPTYNRYGWCDFSGARKIQQMNGLWRIVTPKAELLQNE